MDLTVVFFRAREEGVLAAMCVLAAIQSRLTHRCPRSSRPLYLARMLSDFSRARLLAYCANLLQSRPFPQWDCDSGHRRLMTLAAKLFLYAQVMNTEAAMEAAVEAVLILLSLTILTRMEICAYRKLRRDVHAAIASTARSWAPLLEATTASRQRTGMRT